jgi:hypothetical protein
MNSEFGNVVVSVFPRFATPGALGVFARPEKLQEMEDLEKDRTPRLWEVALTSLITYPLPGIPPIL